MTEVGPRSETLELLRQMEAAGALTPTSLDLSRRFDLGVDNFESIAEFLRRIHDGSKWWTGDLLLEAEARFGEFAYQVATATGRSERTLLNWVWCASRVPRSLRREELSFTHHVLVAPLEYPEQRRWLQRAVDERLSSRELRESIAADRALEEEGTAATGAGCQEILDQAGVALREQLLGCGLPADLAVTIEVAIPPGISIIARTGP